MMLCVFAGTAWAGPTDLPEITTDLENPIYYTIYNTRSSQPGGLMYYAGDGVGMKDGCTSPTLEDKYKFYFTGSHDALYVHNAATTKKLASVSSWSDGGIEWAVGVSPKGGGLAFGPKGGLGGNSCWNEKNYATNANTSDFTTWSANDDGSIFVLGLASEYTFPETGKFYTIECPLFENVQGVKKGLYVTAEGALAWGTVDLTNKNHYWVPTVDAVNNTVVLKNLGTGKYLNGTAMADAEVNATLNALSSTQFNIKVNGTTLHANGHGNGANASGSIINYAGSANSASAWTFVEQEDPDATISVTIKYSFTYNGVEKYTQETSTLVGQEYPTITATFPFGVSAAAKPEGTIPNEGIVDGVKTVEIALSVNLPFVPATDNTSIEHWYFLSIKGNKLICYVEGQSAIDLNVTSVPSTVDGRDACTWAFVGNPFDGYKLYNKKAGLTKILSSNTTMTGQEGSTTYPILTEETMVPAENNTLWFATKSTHQTNGFFLAQNGFESNRMNDRGNKLAYWTGGADNGSTFTVSERDFTGITELEALVNKVKAQQSNYVGGTEVGLYSQASVDAVSVAIDAADAALAGEMTEAISLEHQTAINTAVEGLAFNAPVKGKFYRLKNAASGNYMSGNADNITLLTVAPESAPISTVFYLTEKNEILSFNSGLYLDCKAKAYCVIGTPHWGSFNVAFGGAKANVVTYKNNGYWTYGAGANGDPLDRGDSAPNHAGYNWTLEEVEWLPVPMNEEAGYATLYSPVALSTYKWNSTDAHRVEAYTGVIDGEKLSLTRIDAEDGIIPANTPVVLKYVADAENGTVYLKVSNSEKTAIESDLKGTLADAYITDNSYVLSRIDGVVGFYKAKFNVSTDTTNDGTTEEPAVTYEAFLNNGFKAYLPANTGAESRFLVFNFGDDTETAIEGIEAENTADAVVYDLAGRRVQKAQKGLYIVNGKKVIK